MVYASVDIGSNSGRLLIGKVIEFNGKPMVDKVSLTRVPLRLGMDVFENGFVSREKQDLLIRTFDAYKKLIKVYEPQAMLACATAALREATNAEEILERVYFETGINLQVITGLQEAALIASSSNTNMEFKNNHALFIDIGGGSTELSYFFKGKLVDYASFKIGAIRLLYDSIQKSEWSAMESWVANRKDEDEVLDCFCSGGNINKLTKMFGSKENKSITRSQLADALVHLEGYSVEDRIEEFGLRNDRADVIVPAAIIFKKLMKWADIKTLQAPKFGLADGLIIDLYKKREGQQTIL